MMEIRLQEIAGKKAELKDLQTQLASEQSSLKALEQGALSTGGRQWGGGSS